MQVDEETLAKLLLSVGTSKKWRAMPPITTAKILDDLCKRSSQKEVAKRLGVSSETIRMFRRLLALPKNVQKLVENREIGMDAGYRISLLHKDEQEILANAIIDKKVTSDEVRGIIQSLKKWNPHMPILECVELAIKYRPIIEDEHLLVSRIRESTLNGLKERSEASGILVDDLIKDILKEIIPTEKGFISVKILDYTILLALKKEGFNAFKAESIKSKVKLNDLIDKLIERSLENGD